MLLDSYDALRNEALMSRPVFCIKLQCWRSIGGRAIPTVNWASSYNHWNKNIGAEKEKRFINCDIYKWIRRNWNRYTYIIQWNFPYILSVVICITRAHQAWAFDWLQLLCGDNLRSWVTVHFVLCEIDSSHQATVADVCILFVWGKFHRKGRR